MELETFVVRAKAATYAGDGGFAESGRPGAHDLRFVDGELSYLDSYYGDADFLGQEVVHASGRPVWGMNYYGYLLQPERLTAAAAGRLIKQALSALYAEGRFLGGFSYRDGDLTYVDENSGDFARFEGTEYISGAGGAVYYRLRYHGGLIA
ncbi:hypothetical protein HPO96_28970 [Kribbella sandramycini]|uniref:DUF5680 domain-containing protein n=1 Tax=Kribbella sandramycini TaxID=60450 RepID=A0A7Y4L4L8_9ACTN|nr:DUF5680 domain-containing protein [Kribbella sandramycini]MBB6571643.1 hypothetical protein [Kribbella sandramycini]NOL44288.1 hypothetical protein [Kribbella sandramycini]